MKKLVNVQLLIKLKEQAESWYLNSLNKALCSFTRGYYFSQIMIILQFFQLSSLLFTQDFTANLSTTTNQILQQICLYSKLYPIYANPYSYSSIDSLVATQLALFVLSISIPIALGAQFAIVFLIRNLTSIWIYLLEALYLYTSFVTGVYQYILLVPILDLAALSQQFNQL